MICLLDHEIRLIKLANTTSQDVSKYTWDDMNSSMNSGKFNMTAGGDVTTQFSDE